MSKIILGILQKYETPSVYHVGITPTSKLLYHSILGLTYGEIGKKYKLTSDAVKKRLVDEALTTKQRNLDYIEEFGLYPQPELGSLSNTDLLRHFLGRVIIFEIFGSNNIKFTGDKGIEQTRKILISESKSSVQPNNANLSRIDLMSILAKYPELTAKHDESQNLTSKQKLTQLLFSMVGNQIETDSNSQHELFSPLQFNILQILKEFPFADLTFISAKYREMHGKKISNMNISRSMKNIFDYYGIEGRTSRKLRLLNMKIFNEMLALKKNSNISS